MSRRGSLLRRSRSRLRGYRLERLAGRGRHPLVYGNAVRVLEGGDAAYGALLEALAAARAGIAIEMYTWADDRAGRLVADAVAERAQAGVPVAVLLDSFGSLGSGGIAARLERAGAHVLWFAPLLPWLPRFGINRRNHRKLVLVDGHSGFAGGINIAECYAARFAGTAAWRDLNVRIDGPAVRELARVFVATWIGAGGTPETASAAIGAPADAGAAAVQVSGGRGLVARRRLRGTHLAHIGLARRTLFVANAYFAPELPLLRALRRAARRGVRVRLLLPGISDSPPARWAGRALYGPLLEAGVAIREVHDAVLHAKLAVVDDEILLTGSANLDYRSFRHNLELAVTVLDAAAARAAREAFEGDWERARPVELAAWRARPLSDRILEALATAIRYWL